MKGVKTDKQWEGVGVYTHTHTHTHDQHRISFAVLSDVNPNLCRSVQAALVQAFLQLWNLIVWLKVNKQTNKKSS